MPGNKLGEEKSPYLLQHRHNPVHWFPWGEAAFETARREGKPIFLSIGYSTCYWCHVMERDSFERSEVAEVLNRDFVSIKVDREERPDVDQIYMDVVVGLNGHGGWPMSVFLAPDGKPFWGGTFFWRPQFLQLLEGIADAWQKDRDRVLSSAESIAEAVGERVIAKSEEHPDYSILESAVSVFSKSYDTHYGGFGAAPKFPPSQQLRILLRQYNRSGDGRVLEMAVHTLESMIRGGIYDHLGGGFARYSTDQRWLVPHFEKMLYDNALLVECLLETFQVTGKKIFETVARETLDFILREMTAVDGGFLSAIDAGEVDKEGEFYVWTLAELERTLDAPELKLAKRVFDISEGGNFEGGHIVLALVPGASFDDWEVARALRSKLLAVRDQRKRPHTDDKILAAWNGLAINAFAKAFQVLREKRYLDAATAAAEFLNGHLTVEGQLSRRYRDGAGMKLGFLEDYAFVIEGLISLYEAGFDEKWLLWAKELQGIQERLFNDAADGGYFVSAAPELFVRKKEYFDGAIPAAASASYLNLLRLHAAFPEERYDLRAEELRRSIWSVARQQPSGFSKLLIGVDFLLGPPREIGIIVARQKTVLVDELVSYVQRSFLPRKVLMVAMETHESKIPLLRERGTVDGGTTAYVCQSQRCDLPVTSVDDLKRVLGKQQI